MKIAHTILRHMYYDLPRRLPFPFIFPCRNVVVEITYHCNLDCRMCCFLREIEQNTDSITPRKELTSEQFIAVISSFPKRTNFAFTGGEPFVKKDFLKIVETARARSCQVTIGTNGVLFDKERASAILDSGVEQVCFSLDGPPDLHDYIRRKEGAFESLFSNARRLRAMRDSRGSRFPKIMVNAVILPDNCEALPGTIRLMKEMGADLGSIEAVDGSFESSASRLQSNIDFAANPIKSVVAIAPELLRNSLEQTFRAAAQSNLPLVISPQGMTIDDLVEYYQNRFTMSDWRCTVPWTTCRISPYGDMYPCLNYSIGNVLETHPAKLWSSSRYRTFRKPFSNCAVTPACAGCCKLVRR